MSLDAAYRLMRGTRKRSRVEHFIAIWRTFTKDERDTAIELIAEDIRRTSTPQSPEPAR